MNRQDSLMLKCHELRDALESRNGQPVTLILANLDLLARVDKTSVQLRAFDEVDQIADFLSRFRHIESETESEARRDRNRVRDTQTEECASKDAQMYTYTHSHEQRVRERHRVKHTWPRWPCCSLIRQRAGAMATRVAASRSRGDRVWEHGGRCHQVDAEQV